MKHKVHNAKGLALTEEHDIVYRAAAQPGDPAAAPVPAEQGAAWQREIVPDDVLLFRYSALTFNGHRIHYDHKYVTEIESYRGLIVHGSLIATQLADLVTLSCTARLPPALQFQGPSGGGQQRLFARWPHGRCAGAAAGPAEAGAS